MLRYLLVFVILLAVPVQAREISYGEALQQMFSQHGDLLASEETVSQMDAAKRAAFGHHLPTITLDARYTHMNDDLALRTAIPLSQFIPSVPDYPIEYKLQDQDFYRAYAGATWPVFTGGEVRAANVAAGLQLDAAMIDVDLTRNTLANELTEKYFGLQLAREAAKVRLDVVESLRKHYEDTAAKERVGLVPHVETMHAEVSLNEAVRNYNQAVQDIEIAKAALKNLLTDMGNPNPVTPLFVLNPDYMEDMAYFKGAADTSSPQTRKIDSLQELAGAAKDAKRSTYMPTVYLFGNYEIYKHDLTMLDPEWYVGVGAQWKVFEGFTGHYTYIAAARAEQSAALKSAQAKKDLSTLAEVSYKQMLKAYEKYESAKNNLDFTREYVRVRTKAYENGFATSTDVVDAQTALSKNMLDIISAAYEFDTALSKLLSLTGEYSKFEIYRTHSGAEIVQ